MKNIIVRSFVLGLAVIGFGATTVSAHSSAKAKLVATTQDQPSPICAPSDPSLCGIH